MRLLLDSNVLIWWLSAPKKLSAEVRDAISSIENEVYFSAASMLELNQRQADGQLSFPDNLAETLIKQEILELPVSWKHTKRISSLPQLHKNVMERLLVAQALEESLTLVTTNPKMQQYKVSQLQG